MRDWSITALAVVGAFVVGGAIAAVLAGAAGFWETPAAGFAGAFGAVVAAKVTAPTRGRAAALVVFILGTLIAWIALEPSFYPESHPTKPYEPTHVPFALTALGGVVGLAA